MKLKKRGLFFTLALSLICAVFSLPAAAVSNENSENMYISLSSTAGHNGMFEYDLENNLETYIPNDMSDESLSQIAAAQFSLPVDTLDILPRMKDNRSPVLYPSGYEKSTCLIGARFDDSYVEAGTGFLISKKYLFTAAHMVYNKEYVNNGQNGYAKHVAVYIGASNGNREEYRIAKTYWIGGDYKENSGADDYETKGMFDDWAVLELDSPVTQDIPCLGVRATNSFSSMKNKTYYTQGYPGDRQTVSKWDNFTMYKTSGTIYQVMSAPRFLPVAASGNIMITQGQSGSPLYHDGCAEAIAICGKPSENPTVTCFILINDWLYNKVLTKWS